MTKTKKPRVRWTRGMPTKDGVYLFRDSTVFIDHLPTRIQTTEDGTRVATCGSMTVTWAGRDNHGIYIGDMRYVRLDSKRRKS